MTDAALKVEWKRPHQIPHSADLELWRHSPKLVLKDNASYDNLLGFKGAEALGDFVASLKKPRKIIMLVPAGKMTDDAIEQVAPMLDTMRCEVPSSPFARHVACLAHPIVHSLMTRHPSLLTRAEGARKGPAFFPGGTMSIWEDIREIVEAAAAKAEDGKPCVTMNGNSGAGQQRLEQSCPSKRV
eukprot:5181602-Amphidinium_carterae.1